MNTLTLLKVLSLQCTIWLNIVIIILIYLEVYGNKRDESPVTDAGNPDDISTADSQSFDYKSSILGKPAANRVLKT